MGKPILTKSFGDNNEDGLEQIVEFYRVDINSDTEIVNVEYRIKYLAPKSKRVTETKNFGFTRYNKQAVYYLEGEVIESEQRNELGEITKEAIIAKGGEVKVRENLKFDQLRESPVGKMIIGMLQLDLNNYPNMNQE